MTTRYHIATQALTITAILFMQLMLTSCNVISPENDPITYGENYIEVLLSCDKAQYAPGEPVQLSLSKLPNDRSLTITYRHLNDIIKTEPLTSLSWTWQPPATDYTGYMVDISDSETVYASIGIDVSSSPERFPRNGFLSAYGKMSNAEMSKVIENLNRHHINYLQFQDWHWKHHHPLAGTAAEPMAEWTDIISRNCYKTTVQGYLNEAHKRGMQCLFYNLAYGALQDAADDGVEEEWYVYKDKQHKQKDFHQLGSPFKSSIYLTNPANTEWQQYIAERNNEVYQVFDFDGYQIDQLGSRGNLYDYSGNPIEISDGYKPFIEAMKKAQPDKRLVMNAVGQYGQENGIAKAPVDFLYTEVWDYSNYSVLSDIITENDSWSGGKRTVLAAYMNYDWGKQGRGYFNTPGILMTTAAVSAWGGTILQLGEHMLCNEYFPDENLAMHGYLTRAMISYYDFAVAYENLLRDGGEWYGVSVEAENDSISFCQWAPEINKIATVGKRQTDKDIIHLLSYRGATHLSWCDSDASQTEPDLLQNFNVSIPVKSNPKRVYMASPDYQYGVSQTLDFEYKNGTVAVNIPQLKYWTMVVVEY